METYEKARLIKGLNKIVTEKGKDPMSFDWDAEIDSSLTIQEARNQAIEQLKQMGIEPETTKKENYEEWHNRKQMEQNETINLDKINSLAIIGDTGTAKTNLAIYHLRKYEGTRQIYSLGYPKQIDDFKNLSAFSDVCRLTDSIIFVDELSKYIHVYDRNSNYQLMELISLFEHQNNTLIFTTQLSQFITRGIEAFIDCWNLTRMNDLATLKNGSKPKRIIQNTMHPKCNKWSLALDNGEFLEFSEKNEIGHNGIKKFENQGIKKDWKNSKKNNEKNNEKNNDDNPEYKILWLKYMEMT